MWFWPDVVRYPPDPSRARQLLAGIGLEDRNGDGVLEDARGNEVRIKVLTEGGVETYERELGAVREALTTVGVVLEAESVALPMFQSRTAACDFQAAYHRSPATSMDPAADLDFWLSAGARHVWNPRQRAPGTEWERRIDTLALEQAASADGDRRKDQFVLVQRTLAENLPIIYFAAPRLYYAHTARVGGIVPSIAQPYGLWNGDLLHVVPRE
jgi:peptide/nickel transport system substrate-binding protein